MKNVKPFRLKDPITALYYIPCREVRIKHENGDTSRTKSNLSKKGKVYFINPQKHIGRFLDHTQIFWEKSWGGRFYGKAIVRPSQEWVIEYI